MWEPPILYKVLQHITGGSAIPLCECTGTKVLLWLLNITPGVVNSHSDVQVEGWLKWGQWLVQLRKLLYCWSWSCTQRGCIVGSRQVKTQEKDNYFTKALKVNPCRCRISSGYQLEGNGNGHYHRSPCCADLECHCQLSRPHTGLKLDCLGSNNHLAGDLRKDNSGQNQHYTEPPGFEGVAGNGWGLVGLLYRG